jgi:hypothetical protein
MLTLALSCIVSQHTINGSRQVCTTVHCGKSPPALNINKQHAVRHKCKMAQGLKAWAYSLPGPSAVRRHLCVLTVLLHASLPCWIQSLTPAAVWAALHVAAATQLLAPDVNQGTSLTALRRLQCAHLYAIRSSVKPCTCCALKRGGSLRIARS